MEKVTGITLREATYNFRCSECDEKSIVRDKRPLGLIQCYACGQVFEAYTIFIMQARHLDDTELEARVRQKAKIELTEAP